MAKIWISAPAALKSLRTVSLAALLLLISACAWQPQTADESQTLLLVSLEDGSVIRQDIDIEADVCMKVNGEAATTCFTRGEPILSDDNVHIIGYRMDRSEISLYAN